MTASNRETTISNIEQLLAEGKTVQLHPQGYSMYPMFVPPRDEAILAPIRSATPKRGDVVLYRRDHDILVMHRICKIKNGFYYMVGDNQVAVEGPLRQDQLKGILVAFVRNGKTISVHNPIYKCASHLWLWMRPTRRVFQVTAATVKRILRR